MKKYRLLLGLSLFLLVMPWLLPNRYFLTVAVLIGIYVMMVIGLNLLIGYAGQISLGHAAFFGIGSYTAGVLTSYFKWDSFLSLMVSLLLVAIVAWLIGKPTLKLKGHYLAMATLGFGFIVQIIFGELSITGGQQGLSGIPSLTILGFKFNGSLPLYFLIWGCVILIQAMIINLVGGKIGRAFLAIHTNEVAAESLGVNTAKLKLTVFVISAVLAGLAGAFYAFLLHYISPEPFGLNFSILLVTMVIVGGMGSIWGPVLGAALLGVLPELLRAMKDYDILIYGLLLMLIIIFMPRGIVSLGDVLKQSIGKRRIKSHE